MSTFIQTLIVGIRLGSVYALVALGYTMVYGIIRLINFAHGDFIMVGGYTMIFTVPLALGLPAWAAVAAAVVVCALVGMGTELIAYRPVRKKGSNMTALITAIAMSLFLENLAQAIPANGPNPKVASQIFAAGGVQIGSVTLEYTTILTIIISAVVMVLLYEFTQKTRLGRAMRCVSEDKAAATLMGINVNHTNLLTFAIGSGLAAVAALMFMFIRSKYGRAIRAIRDDEIAASASGINASYYKVLTFAYSAFFAGVAGALYSCANGTLSTSSFAFTNGGILNSTFVVVMVVLGGMGSLTGSVVAAVIMLVVNYQIKNGAWVTALPVSLQALFQYPMLVYAIVLIVVIMFRPMGIFGSYEFSLVHLRGDIKAALAHKAAARAERKGGKEPWMNGLPCWKPESWASASAA